MNKDIKLGLLILAGIICWPLGLGLIAYYFYNNKKL